MKNSSEIIRTIKVLLGIEVNLESMTLDNGTTVEAEVFEAGQEIFILTPSEDEGAQAEKVPMPEGEYTLENGQKLVVNAESLIESIGEAEEDAEAEESPEAEAEPEANQEMETEAPATTPKKVVKSISEEVHFQAIAEKDKEIEDLKAQIAELSKTEEVEVETESEPEAEKVEMEASETADVVHNPEKTPEKVKLSSIVKANSKRQSLYDKLYG